MSGILVIEDSASKGIFPANMKKSLTDKKTYFQCGIALVVFSKKTEDHLFNFEGKCRRHENYSFASFCFMVEVSVEGCREYLTLLRLEFNPK